MTIVLPKNYEAQAAIRERSIDAITEEEALREDIRALRIGIINLFECDEEYEVSLLHPLGRSVMQIEPVLIRLKSYSYADNDNRRVQELYCPFEDVVAQRSLDGLIITGISGDDVAWEQQPFWQEICRILKYARNNIPSTLGISWGAQVIAAFLGIPSERYVTPQLGVFECKNLGGPHRIMAVMDDVFSCPVSRKSGIPDDVLEAERDRGALALLASAGEAGYLMAQTPDNRFLLHFGHPELEADTLAKVYRGIRGIDSAKADTSCGFDPHKPVNNWRGHRSVLFAQWIKYIHEMRSY